MKPARPVDPSLKLLAATAIVDVEALPLGAGCGPRLEHYASLVDLGDDILCRRCQRLTPRPDVPRADSEVELGVLRIMHAGPGITVYCRRELREACVRFDPLHFGQAVAWYWNE